MPPNKKQNILKYKPNMQDNVKFGVGLISENPFVTVIITCYNRKKYLVSAIESVLDQSAPRDSYEIILIKNYADELIDSMCLENRITNLTMEGTIGQYLKEGLKLSRGKLIAFLDDDDRFTHDKITLILKTYMVTDFDYLHNNFFEIDDRGVLKRSIRRKLHLTKDISDAITNQANLNGSSIVKLLKSDADFNMSCITISSRLISYLNYYLDGVTSCQDGFLFYAALNAGKLTVIGDKLTEYRVHESTSNIGGTFCSFSSSILRQGLAEIRSLMALTPALQSELAKKYLQREINIKCLKLYAIVGKEAYSELSIKLTEIVKSYGYSALRYPLYIIWILVYLMSFIFGDLPRRAVYQYINSILLRK